jgi:Tfp pilus assembly protein PilF
MDRDMPEKECRAGLQRIGEVEFVKRLAHVGNESNRRFAFFLGAGCSFSSGIPTAGQLVRDPGSNTDWLRQLRNVRSPGSSDADLDRLASHELSSWNAESPGQSYGDLISKLFLTAGDRQREIERICDIGIHGERPSPNFGYAVLSGLMCKANGIFNVALTTNFDDLLCEAFYCCRETRPLVIHHDSLAPYIRPTDLRPLIIKLHGDHRLSPKNTNDETDSLNEIIAKRVAAVLHDRGLVFIGYGGQDRSIVSLMDQLPPEALPFGVYWISKREPRGAIRPWLDSRTAIWVESQDFDRLMLLVKEVLSVEDPVTKRIEKVHSTYQQTARKLAKGIKEEPPDDVQLALFNAGLRGILSQTDPEFAQLLFEQAIAKSPESSVLLGKFAVFLQTVRHDYDRAQENYNRAIEVNPKDPTNLGNYALFLQTARNDVEKAEEFYKKAVEADPTHANNLLNYALFLQNVRHDNDRAEEFYDSAVKADQKHSTVHGNYALFMLRERKDTDRAEELFKAAVEADPMNVSKIASFAYFLQTVRGDADGADRLYTQAIEIDPGNVTNLASYALFLLNVRRDMLRAGEFLRRAADVGPTNVACLGNYAAYLHTEREDWDQAEAYYNKAIAADPESAICLFNYGYFLQTVRNDIDKAEEFYRRAVEADPTNGHILTVYADFLQNRRHDVRQAEVFYKRAVEADARKEAPGS